MNEILVGITVLVVASAFFFWVEAKTGFSIFCVFDVIAALLFTVLVLSPFLILAFGIGTLVKEVLK